MLSPDGKKAAVTLVGETQDIWLVDLERDGMATRFTFDGGDDITPIWSPDGSRLAFGSRRGSGDMTFLQKAATGAGAPDTLVDMKLTNYLTSWSPDGGYVLYTDMSAGRGDIWILPLGTERKPFQFLGDSFPQSSAQFSPDGRWIAYQAFESTRPEIYVAPFSGQAGVAASKWEVSGNGGTQTTMESGREGTLLFDARTRTRF